MKKNILLALLFFKMTMASGQASLVFSSSKVIGAGTTTVTFSLLLTPNLPNPIFLGNFDVTLNFLTANSATSAVVTTDPNFVNTNGTAVAISPEIEIVSPGVIKVSINAPSPSATSFNNIVARIASGTPPTATSLGTFTVTFTGATSGVFSCGGVNLSSFNSTTRALSSVATTCTGSQSLPLDLLDFQANNKSGKPQLSWLTASEVNVQGFDVERSATGKVFEKVGYVKSAGTPRGSYSFTDEVPMNGANYYRLKMMNTDGSFAYSPVRGVTLSEGRTTGLSVSPNPAKEAVTVKLNATEAKTTTLELVDIAGKVLLTDKKKVEVGFNQLSLNLSNYPAGMYFLKVDGVAHRLVIAE